MRTGYFTRPCMGQAVSGDMGAWWEMPGRNLFVLADGLGHGPAAHYAAQLAIDCVSRNREQSLSDIFKVCDAALRGSRGVAMALAAIDSASGTLSAASIGNIRVILLGGKRDRRLGGGRGIVGGGYVWVPEDVALMDSNDMLILFSDGIDEMAPLRSSPLCNADLLQPFAVDIVNRWSRMNDDATVLAYRHESSGTEHART